MKWQIAGFHAGVTSLSQLKSDQISDNLCRVSTPAGDSQQWVKLTVGTTHLKAAEPVHMSIVWLTGLLAMCCVAAGANALVRNFKTKTHFRIFGASLTTGSVGVAFVGIGLILGFFTFRDVLKSTRELAGIPDSMPQTVTNSAIAGGIVPPDSSTN